jgi:hypothetical protein
MFYVSDIDGLKFKGPLEKLEKWRTVLRKTRSKHKHLKERKSSFTFKSMQWQFWKRKDSLELYPEEIFCEDLRPTLN